MRSRAESGFYHVMLRGNGRQLIFEDDADRREFLSCLDNAIEREGVSLIAWCLMDNHVHLIIDDPHDRLSTVMYRIGMKYAMYFNNRHQREGHLFEGRFKSSPIESDEYLVQAVRYVLNNPVAAGISTLEDYRWSSYAEYCGERGLTNTKPILDMFSSVEDFVSFCREAAPVFDGKLEFDNVPDQLVKEVATNIAIQLGCTDLSKIKALSLKRRGAIVRALRDAGLTVNQISRLIGISSASLYRSLKRK
ncbi:transposase [uncultured Enorma sp.]|jgi:putative transposase|uniref:transposase n=1 Tax=uncultured Enorma sp. TaxID=1714346 RepID=UPI0025FF476A|nr:transposase [uncultured Enorma sp.]